MPAAAVERPAFLLNRVPENLHRGELLMTSDGWNIIALALLSLSVILNDWRIGNLRRRVEELERFSGSAGVEWDFVGQDGFVIRNQDSEEIS